MNNPQYTVAQFFDKLANRWDACYQRSYFLAQRYNVLAREIECFADSAHSALDYGCGSGVLTSLLVGRFKYVVAVDISEGMRRNTELKFASEPSVSVMDTSMLGKVVFDLVLCSSVIEYVDEPREFLLKIYSYMKPKGIFLLTVPNRMGVAQILSRLTANLQKESFMPYQKHLFSKKSIYDLMCRNGFHVVSLSSAIGLPLIRSIGMEELILCVAQRL
jgi:2-polyprenyl-3-methyl-5-hydroxy-6-metoxy-1,4-benzoquinol methylase